MKKSWIIVFWIFILACQDIENCGTDDSLDFIVVRFRDIETQESKTVGFRFSVDNSPYQWRFLADTTIVPSDTTIVPADTSVVDGETVITPADTTIIPADTTIVSDSTFVLFPLNPDTETTTFRFDTDTSNHVMELSYEVEYSIFDPECEPSLTFKKIDTVRHTFDSLSIPGRVTNRQLSTNVEIFL